MANVIQTNPPTETSASRVYSCRELRELIHEHQTVFDLWDHLVCNKINRETILYVLSTRLRKSLFGVLPANDAVAVSEMLAHTTSAIVGEFALNMTGVVNLPITVLCVATIGRDVIVWLDALWNLGYRPHNQSVSADDQDSLLRIAPGHRNILSQCLLRKKDQAQAIPIQISFYNRDSFIPHVLRAPFTCDMVFVTDSGVYCMYPRLLRQMLVLSVDGSYPDREKALRSAGFRVGKSMRDFGLKCSEACLSVVRHVEPGMSTHLGVRFCFKREFNLSLGGELRWQLGLRCRNEYGHGEEYERSTLNMEYLVRQAEGVPDLMSD